MVAKPFVAVTADDFLADGLSCVRAPGSPKRKPPKGANPFNVPKHSSMVCEKEEGEVQADRKVTPCAFLPWVDRVGGRSSAGRRTAVAARRPVVGRTADGCRRRRCRHDVSGAEKKSV